jgi:serine/threonine protein kinase
MVSGMRLFKRDVDAALGREDEVVGRLEMLRPQSANRVGVDIMMKLLKRDPERRLTAVAALEHPWLTPG